MHGVSIECKAVAADDVLSPCKVAGITLFFICGFSTLVSFILEKSTMPFGHYIK